MTVSGGDYGINASNNAGSLRFSLTNSEITVNPYVGIDLEPSNTGAVIAGNSIHDNGNGNGGVAGIRLNAIDATVSNNVFDNDNTAIMGPIGSGLITGNTILDNAFGITISGIYRLIVAGNSNTAIHDLAGLRPVADFVQTGLLGLPGVTVTPSTVAVADGDTSATVSVVLLAPPTDDFTITLNLALVTFSGGAVNGSLLDGRYRLSVLSALVHDEDSVALDGDNDRQPGGDSITFFLRLIGDANGDGTIDGADLVLLGNAFSTNTVAFDINFDGTVDGADLAIFGNRFGTTL